MSHRSAIANDLFHRDLVIRRASDGDRAALRDLAVLDSTAPLRGDVLVAEVGAEMWAALSLNDGRGIADPFRPSAGALEMLRVRARHLAGAWRPSRRAAALRAPGRSASSL
jgi:hypothetical protein